MFKNIAANFFGRFWSIISNFLFLPLYIHILGFENYSIISFTLVIAGFMAFLDSGLTSTLSREFAKNTSVSEKINTFITLETMYLIIVTVVTIVIIIAAPVIVEKWINLETNQNVTWLIRIISFDIGFQMLLRFYLGGLLGLEKQVKANVVQILWGVFRNGLVLIVILLTPTLEVFFMWQSFCTVVFAIIYRLFLTKELYGKPLYNFTFRIDRKVLQTIGKFAGGMLLISLVAGINTQLDKMTISKLLPLEELGYYTLAVSLATAVAVLVNPIATALLPRFTSLFSVEKKQDIIDLFKRVNLYTIIIITCILAILVIYPKTILWVWTGENYGEKVSSILQIMAFAYAFISFSIIPYNIAIANGYTKLNNILGISSVLFTIPGYYFATRYYGVLGAAAVFAFVQFFTTFIYVYLVNRKFLQIPNFVLYIVKNFILPIFTSIAVAYFCSIIFNSYLGYNKYISGLVIILTSILICLLNFVLFISKADKIYLYQKIELAYGKLKSSN